MHTFSLYRTTNWNRHSQDFLHNNVHDFSTLPRKLPNKRNKSSPESTNWWVTFFSLDLLALLKRASHFLLWIFDLCFVLFLSSVLIWSLIDCVVLSRDPPSVQKQNDKNYCNKRKIWQIPSQHLAENYKHKVSSHLQLRNVSTIFRSAHRKHSCSHLIFYSFSFSFSRFCFIIEIWLHYRMHCNNWKTFWKWQNQLKMKYYPLTLHKWPLIYRWLANLSTMYTKHTHQQNSRHLNWNTLRYVLMTTPLIDWCCFYSATIWSRWSCWCITSNRENCQTIGTNGHCSRRTSRWRREEGKTHNLSLTSIHLPLSSSLSLFLTSFSNTFIQPVHW